MKNPIIAYVGWLLLIATFGFYAYGIITAIGMSWGSAPLTREYNEVLSTTVASIQALLLTNLGILLGISITHPGSNLAKQLMLNRKQQSDSPKTIPPPLELRETVQLFALAIFVIGLLACLVTWAADDFTSEPKQVVSVVSSSGKMFIGVALAYLTAVLR